jgi:predicted phosphodiesterase
MKIRLLSDLHLEHGPIRLAHAGEDVMILAGDIATHTDAMPLIKEMADQFGVAILVLAGNHEFYSDVNHHPTWEKTIDDLKAAADHTDMIEQGKVTFFEDQTVVYQGVRFIGATLWTDMNLYGDFPIAITRFGDFPDYVFIRKDDGKAIMPLDTVSRHTHSRRFITDTLAQPFDGQTVVFTHHAPSWLSIADRYKADRTSAAYASRLEDLMLSYEPVLWIHGHTHTVMDYMIGKTRIMCNPSGYRFDKGNGFNPNLIVEV